MPVISRVEGKSLKGRLIYAAIFFVLTLGGITMIYPFAIMISGSFRSEMDGTDLDLLPGFWRSTQVLQRKFAETKYNQDVSLLNRSLLQQNFSFRAAAVPEDFNPALAEELRRYMMDADLPDYWKALGGTRGVRTRSENLRTLQDRLARQFNNDLNAFGSAMGGQVPGWATINFPAPDWPSRRFELAESPIYAVYHAMLQEAPAAEIILVSLSGYFLEVMIYPVYGQREVTGYNKAHRVPLTDYSEFRLPRTVPTEDPTLRAEWVAFVSGELSPAFVEVRPDLAGEYGAYLLKQYETLDRLNEAWGTSFASINEVRLPRRERLFGAMRQDYRDFLLTLEPEEWVLAGPEYEWKAHLVSRHGSLAGINHALGTDYASLDAIYPPMVQLEREHVLTNAGKLRWTYSIRNYVNVFAELFLRGRAFVNTLIFCSLAVISALLVNPMAAYAMSRIRLPGTYRILMILMATIAFPPMVATIPQFILLREANLLNTFVALVLPAIANGYLIFLLKGFFDSLPTELYEAATLDGASEVRIFFQITMSLSKPILAVVALGAFNGAYGAFLYPLIVAPRTDMWVLNVWLYQWQQTSSTPAVFASVLIASIPTILVFLIAQNIIMRGIVVPTEK